MAAGARMARTPAGFGPETELARIGESILAQPTFEAALELILAEARRLTQAEAGTVYLRDGDYLRFAVVQNDSLTRRLGEAETKRLLTEMPFPITEPSIAGHVAVTGISVNEPNAYAIPRTRPYTFDQDFDKKTGYRTHSILAVALTARDGRVFAVLELINVLDEWGGAMPFDPSAEDTIARLLATIGSVLYDRLTG
jgi:GAF domain-containing protein